MTRLRRFILRFDFFLLVFPSAVGFWGAAAVTHADEGTMAFNPLSPDPLRPALGNAPMAQVNPISSISEKRSFFVYNPYWESYVPALRWLASRQNADGSWADGDPSLMALAVYCFLSYKEGAPAGSELGPVVRRAIGLLLAEASEEQGGHPQDPKELALVACALAACCREVCPPSVKETTERVFVDLLRIRPDALPDEALGWFALAIFTARQSEILDVPGLYSASRALAKEILRKAASRPTITEAEAMALALFRQGDEADAVLASALEQMENLRPEGTPFSLFAGMALCQAGHDLPLFRWWKPLHREIPETQVVLSAEKSGWKDDRGRPVKTGYFPGVGDESESARIAATCFLSIQYLLRFQMAISQKPRFSRPPFGVQADFPADNGDVLIEIEL